MIALPSAWTGIGPASILVGMEASGTIRDAFRARGFDAWSCDLRECEADPAYHFTGDVFAVLGLGWRLAIFHPDCTYLTGSGLHWNHRVPGRHACTLYGLNTVRRLMVCTIPMVAIENPKGAIATNIRPADQRIQPHDFGEDASKDTRLWLRGLPKLRPTGRRPGRIVAADPADLFGGGTERWSNQADDGQNRLGETRDRWRLRSLTYPGVAAAMAHQWGDWLESMVPGAREIACTSHNENGPGGMDTTEAAVPGADAGTGTIYAAPPIRSTGAVR